MSFDVHQWAEEFFRQPIERMSETVATAFASMAIAEVQHIEDAKRQAVIEAQFLYKIVEAKCAKYNVPMTKYAKMFMFALARNPADVTMYIVALRAKKKGKVIDMEMLGWLFPEGFLTEAAMQHMWGLQKNTDSSTPFIDNQLDLLSGDF